MVQAKRRLVKNGLYKVTLQSNLPSNSHLTFSLNKKACIYKILISA